MIRKEIFEQLNEIFKDVFDDVTIELTETTSAEDIEDWDSFEQINLMVAIEDKFKTKFTLNESSELKNVGAMVSLIEKKLS